MTKKEHTVPIRLGLRENLGQFSLLVLVNGFVGAMVGLERSILPAIAEQEFQIAARAAILSFIVVFGATKALTNYFAGRLSDRFGRKLVLVAGWLVAIPVPFVQIRTAASAAPVSASSSIDHSASSYVIDPHCGCWCGMTASARGNIDIEGRSRWRCPMRGTGPADLMRQTCQSLG